MMKLCVDVKWEGSVAHIWRSTRSRPTGNVPGKHKRKTVDAQRWTGKILPANSKKALQSIVVNFVGVSSSSVKVVSLL